MMCYGEKNVANRVANGSTVHFESRIGHRIGALPWYDGVLL